MTPDPAPLMPYERKSFSVGMPLNDKFRENYDAIDWSDEDTPRTCVWCMREPATHIVVDGVIETLACDLCVAAFRLSGVPIPKETDA